MLVYTYAYFIENTSSAVWVSFIQSFPEEYLLIFFTRSYFCSFVKGGYVVLAVL